MNISGLSQFGEEFTQPLVTLYKRTGNTILSGFLGDSIKSVSPDEEGRLQFSTLKENDGYTIQTQGVVLSSSVLLKQTAKDKESASYRIYSWDLEDSRYTYLSFDQEYAMNHFFDVIKRFDANLCDEDISSLFQEMGLTFDSVTQVLVNQKRNTSDRMNSGDSRGTEHPHGY